MDKKPKRSWQEWEDIIFHKGSYVALAISLMICIPAVIFLIITLFTLFGLRAFLILYMIAALVFCIACFIRISV